MLGRSGSNSEVYPASRCVSLSSGTVCLASGPSRGSRIAPVELAGNHGPAGRWLLRAPPLRTRRRRRRASRNRRETPGRNVPRLTKRDWCSSSRRAWPNLAPPSRAGAVGRSRCCKAGSEFNSVNWGFRQNLLAIVQRNQLAVVRQESKAVLGHWLMGYVHPYPDGNGRIARFLMNAMLASGGYPWTVIRISARELYLAALDSAKIDQEIGPFARCLAERVRWSKSSQFG